MDAGGGGFAGSVEAGERGTSPEIGFDAAHHEVRGGTDGGNVARKIEAVAETSSVDARETLLEKFFRLGGHVEVNVVGIRAMHFADDGAGNNIAWCEFLGFVIALHEAFEMNIAEGAAFTAKGFAEEEARGAFHGKGSGMELDKFHVGEDCSGIVGDGHSITSGDFWISGFTIELTESAGGKERSSGAKFVERRIVFIEKANANSAIFLDDEFGGKGVRAEMEMRDGMSAGEKGAADFASRGIAMSVENARAAVSGFTSKRELGARAIKFGAPLDELSDVAGAFFN